MPDFITIRETIEYTLRLPRDPAEREYFEPDFTDADDIRSVIKEVIECRHEPDYVLDCDLEREVHILLADSVEVFASRSHDVVYEHFKELTNQPDMQYVVVGDLENPDEKWEILREAEAARVLKAARR